MDIKIKNLFALENLLHRKLFERCEYPWEVVAKLEDYIKSSIKPGIQGIVMPQAYVADDVELGEGSVVEPTAVVLGPTIIGKNCVIRSGAYIRGNTILEDSVTIGHATEVKNSYLMHSVAAAHFNYVGDSVLGVKAHLAGGAHLTNTKLTKAEVSIKTDSETIPTGLRKFGAAIADEAEIGAGAILNPGSIIGKRSIVYPLVSWRGVLDENKIAKAPDLLVDRT